MLELAYRARRAVLLEGPTGIGKSEIVRQVADRLGVATVVLDLSLLEPPDLVGLPVIHEGRTDVIYACGPMGMLRQVTAIAGRYDIPAQVLVEEQMACGTGVCMTCVLPVVGEDGVTRMVRSCTDGPVFRGDQVRWEDVGTVPFDALGAPGWKPRRPAGPRPATNGRPTDGD